MNLVFYRCAHCGNVVWKLYDSGAPVSCCGEPMQELMPNTVDAAQEKHVPVITKGNGLATVSVGSVTHPMEDKHYIGFIALQSGTRVTLQFLSPGDSPKMTAPDGENFIAYAWCNLHGLWKGE